ncbi:hypothetical protein [Pseudoalteromonas rubra]|uniref:Uncharacterized protein n=1 Tax=Pseudoalteromonas rubra TaxID=43658 RepID=A0A4V2E3Y9_9GAMM|nr:hypothetical protein [Pseudoalteromonas rubra]RZM84162.1 hypothetical protein C3B51_04370 [Pseudoalteromonas rubra]
MGRFQSAIHNIGHHAVSGLCDILAEGYAYCAHENKEVLEIDILNSYDSYTPELDQEISQLKEKAFSIITTTCGVSINDIQVAKLSINYRFTEQAYQQHKSHMKKIGVWYGHDPLYNAIIVFKLKNGRVAKSEFSSKAAS